VVIKVVAKRFDYTPNVIKLKKGVPVTLELTTKDVVMGFSAPDFATRADIIPGKTARVRFVPDKAGTFTFVCDIFCGTGHEQMEGTIEGRRLIAAQSGASRPGCASASQARGAVRQASGNAPSTTA
jgi:cytochrome c oxidase subunit 2